MTDERVLCVVICGAGPAAEVGELLGAAEAAGWSVLIVATRSALPFLEVEALEARTGRPVRSAYGVPGRPRQASAATAAAVLVAPATFNFVNKLAAGIADDYALGVVAEAIGLGKPVAVMPVVGAALGSRAPFVRAVESLRAEGVTVLLENDGPFLWADGLAAVS